MKKRIVVICPGRGTYTKETLGYLTKYGSHIKDFISDCDNRRKHLGEPTITELDSMDNFKPAIHTRGEHASSLIYACSYADFMSIDTDRFEICAVLGNSMGWYLTLAYAGALNWESSFNLINTMGSMMKTEIIGGQVIYPIVDQEWKKSQTQQIIVDRAVRKVREIPGCEVYPSIYLGGYIVLGANKSGITALLKELPAQENYPFQLINHAAFHTPLLNGISERAFATIPQSSFQRPKIPMIDGRGKIWQPYSTDTKELYEYTLGHQVVDSYDFSKSLTVALKEYCPDHLVLLGPGGTLGGSIGQIMIENNWKGISNKAEFTALQSSSNSLPYLISMGREDQRIFCTKM